jgi:hypothetical protein
VDYWIVNTPHNVPIFLDTTPTSTDASATRVTDAKNSRAFAAIFSSGFLCGCMDISAAFITWWPKGVKPFRLLQGIAAGWLGPESFQGGTPTVLLGLAFHFLIALTAAAIFYAASRKLTFMIRRPILSGVLYGVAVYLVMYWVVMPLSNFHGTKTVTSSIYCHRDPCNLRRPPYFSSHPPLFPLVENPLFPAKNPFDCLAIFPAIRVILRRSRSR